MGTADSTVKRAEFAQQVEGQRPGFAAEAGRLLAEAQANRDRDPATAMRDLETLAENLILHLEGGADKAEAMPQRLRALEQSGALPAAQRRALFSILSKKGQAGKRDAIDQAMEMAAGVVTWLTEIEPPEAEPVSSAADLAPVEPDVEPVDIDDEFDEDDYALEDDDFATEDEDEDEDEDEEPVADAEIPVNEPSTVVETVVEDEPTEPEPESEPEPEPVAEALPLAVPVSESLPLAVPVGEPAREQPAEPTLVEQNTATSTRSGVGGVIAALVVLALLIAGAWLLTLAVVQAQESYTVRDAVVRDEPSKGSADLGRLPRGAPVSGETVLSPEGKPWMKLDSGPYAGEHVSMVNIRKGRPPELTRRYDDAGRSPPGWPLREATKVRDKPSSFSSVLEEEDAGTRLLRVGDVKGGWIEITRVKGGVGYVRADAFEPEPAASASMPAPAVEAPTRAPSPPKAEKPRPAPVSAEPAPQAPAPGSPVREPEAKPAMASKAPTPKPQAPAPERKKPSPPAPKPTAVPPRATASPPPVSTRARDNEPRNVPAAPPPARVVTPTVPRHIQRPDWSSLPRQVDILRATPQAAKDARLSGVVTMECTVSGLGLLSQCDILSERPAGWGFGDAARRLAPTFQMQPRDFDGMPVEGRRIRIPMAFSVRESR